MPGAPLRGRREPYSSRPPSCRILYVHVSPAIRVPPGPRGASPGPGNGLRHQDRGRRARDRPGERGAAHRRPEPLLPGDRRQGRLRRREARELVAVRDRRLIAEVEALSQLLEGQGLSYAVRLDSSGQSVDMLFVMGKGQPATASSSPPPVSKPQADRSQESYDADQRNKQVEADAALEEAQDPTKSSRTPSWTRRRGPRGRRPRPSGRRRPFRRARGTEAAPFAAPWQTLSRPSPRRLPTRLPVALLHEVADHVHDHVRRARGLRAAHGRAGRTRCRA